MTSNDTNAQHPPVGTFGIWARGNDVSPAMAGRIEELGYGALWIGGSPSDDLMHVERLLDATSTITVATGIVNIWNTDPVRLAASYHRVAERHPHRLLLGIGAGHPESSGPPATKPVTATVRYLDELDRAGVPGHDMVLAALGPRMLALARERTAGAHPYLVTPRHTKTARDILGPLPLLAPEQRVVLRADPEEARAIGRPTIARPYLGLVNYRHNLERLGFTEEDLRPDGSDRLIDELVVYGDGRRIAERLHDHLEAGADHVAIQLLHGEGDDPEADYEALAALLAL
ncbi:MAG TPA: LLM class F420-dependent oxidoreductase [Lacisediminihabitans sp.]|uniref:LLM class F420-dependent oxidoreductase n=1 Tax=Lacisediminihabitans sp. TaxID=2787631 RepID=UPI002EDB6E30